MWTQTFFSRNKNKCLDRQARNANISDNMRQATCLKDEVLKFQ